MVDLAAPWALLLLPLPLLVMRLLRPRKPAGHMLVVPDRIAAQMMAAGGHHANRPTAKLRNLKPWGAWVLLVLALAGQRELAPVSALKVSGRDLAIVLDLSGSMVRDDFFLDGAPITRLDAVKQVGAQFARSRAGDRVALIVFGSTAYYAAPFSFDVEAIARRIEQATIGISGRATNISDGLGLALKRMQNSDAASRVVILLSDGKNNAGATNPRGVAQFATTMGVRVHTIALGPKDVASAAPGERGVVDAATLQAMSELTGGQSFRVRTMEDLQDVSAALDRLEATESHGLAADVYRALWIWPAAAAVLICSAIAWRSEP